MLAHPSEDITRTTTEIMRIETTGQWGACETCFQVKAKRHAVPNTVHAQRYLVLSYVKGSSCNIGYITQQKKLNAGRRSTDIPREQQRYNTAVEGVRSCTDHRTPVLTCTSKYCNVDIVPVRANIKTVVSTSYTLLYTAAQFECAGQS